MHCNPMTMKPILITVLTAWLSCNLIAGAADKIATPIQSLAEKDVTDPVLLLLQSRFEQELGDLNPKPAFEVPSNNSGKILVMRFKVREYMVYPHDMTGHLGADLVKQEGPGDDGVLLRINVQPKGEMNQACVPQTLQEPYWSTFLNVYPVAGTEKQIFVALSFRGGTQKTLIRKIQNIAEHPFMAKPARDAATVMPRIRKVLEGVPTYAQLSDILGEPDMDIGSGIHIFVYHLGDGTAVTVGTPDKAAVTYVNHANKRVFPHEKKPADDPEARR